MTLRRLYVNGALLEKTCKKCKKTFPRNQEYFYAKPHRTQIDSLTYNNICIACDNKRGREWRKNNREYKLKKDREYKSSERGYFKEMWQAIKCSKHGCEFKDYDEFFNSWVEQQKTYGKKCPYLNIEMTTKKGVQSFYGKKIKTCPTNISKDRIDSKRPYSKNNLMFVCWKVNSMKGNLTPLVAKRFLGFYKERFDNEQESSS